MRITFFLLTIFFISSVTAQEFCDDGSLNTTNCNPCTIKANQDKCKAISQFHECSATKCDGACSFDCPCKLVCTMEFKPCVPECGPGYRCGRAPCSCEPMCVPVKQCKYGNYTFEDGETFKDDCNQCSCNDGEVVCTRMACPPAPTCPAGKTFTKICPNSACALLDCMEGNDCEIDQCDNCEAKCKPNYCMVKGKKINNGMSFIDGCKRCICENGVASCSKPDPKCVAPTCHYGKRQFQQVCEDKCALIRVKCPADTIPCQIDQCDKCKVRTCISRTCNTMRDCDAELGQVCYFANIYDKSMAGVCRTFEPCNCGGCPRGSTPLTNKTDKKCYCVPNQVTTNALELDQQGFEAPQASSATITSASTVVALITAAGAML